VSRSASAHDHTAGEHMKIVITGNMGCGKSTAVKTMLSLLPSYLLFDYDAAVHALYEDETVQLHLDIEYGTHIRHEISNIVFSDPTKLELLKSIFSTHLKIRMEQISEHEDVIYDIPLYFEMEGTFPFHPDYTIAVTADSVLQSKRIMMRTPGITSDKIQAILSHQLPQAEKMRRADIILTNDYETIDEFIQYVETFVSDYPEVFSNE
jgi:dephospho-CoA kinase